jgi:hypothetical protein
MPLDAFANQPESTDSLAGSAAPAGTGTPGEPSQAATSQDSESWKQIIDSLPPEVRPHAERAVQARAAELQRGLTPRLDEASKIRNENRELRERLDFIERRYSDLGAGQKMSEDDLDSVFDQPIETPRQFFEVFGKVMDRKLDERFSTVDEYMNAQRAREVTQQLQSLSETFPQLRDGYEQERLKRYAYDLLENKRLGPADAAKLLYHDELIAQAEERGRQQGLQGIKGAQTAAGASERPSGGSPGVPAIKPISAEEWQKDKYGAFERIARDLGQL